MFSVFSRVAVYHNYVSMANNHARALLIFNYLNMLDNVNCLFWAEVNTELQIVVHMSVSSLCGL